MTAHRVRRTYTVVDGRQVHCRTVGSGPPVILLPDAERSSASVPELAAALASHRTVLALDLPGYGGSEPLDPARRPSIEDYAEAVARTLSAFGVGRCAVVGVGVGALIALELARVNPELVGSLVLDTPLLLTPAQRSRFRRAYCPDLTPRRDGGHLWAAWRRRRDEEMFFPWFAPALETRRRRDLPSAQELQRDVMDTITAGDRYADAHQAAFDHDVLIPERWQTAVTPLIIFRADGVTEEMLAALPAAVRDRVRVVVAETDEQWAGAMAAELLADPAAGTRPGSIPEVPLRPGRITKSYVSTGYGDMLIRRAGPDTGVPLVMMHGSPASGARMEPLMTAMAAGRPVIALDTLGNGESDKPAFAEPWAGDYAAAAQAALDGMGVQRFDLYGTHTGGVIATELAVTQPDRVRGLILEGVLLHDDDFVTEVLANYFPPFAVAPDGSHLAWAWSFVSDQWAFFPWYNHSVAGIRWIAPLSAAELNQYTILLMQAADTYHLAYRAAFKYRTRERLPLVLSRVFVCSEHGDMLDEYSSEAAAMVAGAEQTGLPDDIDARAALFANFLDHCRSS